MQPDERAELGISGDGPVAPRFGPRRVLRLGRFGTNVSALRSEPCLLRSRVKTPDVEPSLSRVTTALRIDRLLFRSGFGKLERDEGSESGFRIAVS